MLRALFICLTFMKTFKTQTYDWLAYALLVTSQNLVISAIFDGLRVGFFILFSQQLLAIVLLPFANVVVLVAAAADVNVCCLHVLWCQCPWCCYGCCLMPWYCGMLVIYEVTVQPSIKPTKLMRNKQSAEMINRKQTHNNTTHVYNIRRAHVNSSAMLLNNPNCYQPIIKKSWIQKYICCGITSRKE